MQGGLQWRFCANRREIWERCFVSVPILGYAIRYDGDSVNQNKPQCPFFKILCTGTGMTFTHPAAILALSHMLFIAMSKKLRCTIILSVAIPALFGACLGGKDATFNVRDYGARGDGRAMDSPAIQKAIDACALAGGGMVRLPPGAYLSGPLYLRGNHITFHLEAGAILQGTEDFTAYRGSNGKLVGLINAERLKDVSISGPGIIDGQGAPWWPAVREAKKTGAREPRQRPKMVNFHDCHRLTVRDVTLQNSPMFHLVPVDCDDVLIDHVTIKAPSNSPNTDAIDPSSCRNVRILNCLLDVGDDNVAVKAGHSVAGRDFCCQDILVSNCTCLAGHGISIGSETSAGVSNFVVVHCTFNGTASGIRIKTTRRRAARLNIYYTAILP